jgi:hypothetical protein
MMTTTPLRLVAIEESPLTEDDQSATPVAMMSEQDAITRKVPESAMIPPPEPSLPVPPKRRLSRLHILLPAGAVAVAIAVVVVVLATKGKSPSAPAPVSATAVPAEAPQPQPAAAPVAPSAGAKAGAEIIRLGVTAEPMETELSLDGNVLAGHRLNIEVPKDRGIHVVSASAPGYIPFNQQVSFSSDVFLKISLRRAHTPPPARQASRARPSQVESKVKINARPTSASPGPGLEPGMNLDGPSPRPNAKPIDERNPYKP